MKSVWSKQYFKDLVYRVNGAAIEVHKTLGSGLLESVYHRCLKYELEARKIAFVSEARVPVHFKELEFDTDFRCDLIVEDSLVVELKSVEHVLPVHQAQVLTYMKLLELPMGLLINFNVAHIFKEGQRTFVNELYRELD